jgi:hypothetical protein
MIAKKGDSNVVEETQQILCEGGSFAERRLVGIGELPA